MSKVKWNIGFKTKISEYERMTKELEEDQEYEQYEKELMEKETLRLIEEQQKEREKAIARTQGINDAMIRAEIKERERREYMNTPEGRLVKQRHENHLIYERDRETMTTQQIKERNTLRLEDEKVGQDSIRYEYSADPRKYHRREIRYEHS